MDRRVSRCELSTKKLPEGGPMPQERAGLWISLHGGVFDITSFLRGHPGGQQVMLSYCGGDATAAFDEVGHSRKAMDIALRRCILGLLADCEQTGFVSDALVSG
jgi:hypothetical protein